MGQEVEEFDSVSSHHSFCFPRESKIGEQHVLNSSDRSEGGKTSIFLLSTVDEEDIPSCTHCDITPNLNWKIVSLPTSPSLSLLRVFAALFWKLSSLFTFLWILSALNLG